MLTYFWKLQPTNVRLILLVQFVLIVIAVLRSLRLAWRLYRRWDAPVVLEEAVAVSGPDVIARSALANRIRIGPAKEKRANSDFAATASKEAVLFGLRMAEADFLYVWTKCCTDSESIMRASKVTLLLTFVMIAGGASAIYSECLACYNCSVLTALRATIDQLLTLLALGLSVCTSLYIIHSFFERLLADRRARWTYYCSHLMNELNRE